MLIDILLHDVKRPTTLICSYSPPNSSSTIVRRKIYSQLEKIVTPNSWLLGDLNARVGRRISTKDTYFGGMHSNTVGPCSLKNDITLNENGSSLLHIAALNNLRHVLSHFRMRDSKRWTWLHPCRTVLDHVCVPAPYMCFISRCFTPADFEFSSEH